MSQRFVALYRVSTSKQKDSNLGLAAQQYAVRAYIKTVGGELIKEFTEVISGSNKDVINTRTKNLTYEVLLDKRPVLREAIKFAEDNNAVLACKEVSRITRFGLLFENLMTYRVPFVCTDYPTDDQMMLKLRVIFAEQENVLRSQRTKLALDQKRLQGVRLGSTRGFTDEHRKRAVIKISTAASTSIQNRQAIHTIKHEVKDGKTFTEIAEVLNNLGYKTRRGNPFQRMTVKQLYQSCVSRLTTC